MTKETIKNRIATIKAIQTSLQNNVANNELDYYYKHSKKLSSIRFNLSMKLLTK